MTERKIMIDTIEKVKNFVQIAGKCPWGVDLVSDRYVVDAKSLMGILSLDISKPVLLRIHTDDSEDFMKEIEAYTV